jgi:hypothetical protein
MFRRIFWTIVVSFFAINCLMVFTTALAGNPSARDPNTIKTSHNDGLSDATTAQEDTFTIQYSVAPEPGSIALIAIVAVPILGMRRRKG